MQLLSMVMMIQIFVSSIVCHTEMTFCWYFRLCVNWFMDDVMPFSANSYWIIKIMKFYWISDLIIWIYCRIILRNRYFTPAFTVYLFILKFIICWKLHIPLMRRNRRYFQFFFSQLVEYSMGYIFLYFVSSDISFVRTFVCRCIQEFIIHRYR